MLSRPCLLTGLGCCALMFAMVACQAYPVGETMPTAIAQPTAPVSATASVSNSVVWARIPYCGCVYGAVATDNVSGALKRAQLVGTLKLLNPTGGWMYFVVAFDPQTASREQITAAIVAGGGEVVAEPP